MNKGINPPTLLIIDDSLDIIAMISELFSEEYECINATDGDTGISLAIEKRPNIILCDVRMPKKSGMEVVRELKDNHLTRYIPIILLTGYNTRENRLEGLRAMADDFIAKPFDSEELRIKMSNLLKLRSEMFENESLQKIGLELDIDTNNFSHDNRYFIELFNEYLLKNYQRKDLEVQHIADYMEISVRQLQRKIKDITNISPMDLLRTFRLNQAAKLLSEKMSISDVSNNCGFRSSNYFCTCFKKHFQVTPSFHQKSK